jgi:hypothetical protein
MHPAPLLTVDAVRDALSLGTPDQWFEPGSAGGLAS